MPDFMLGIALQTLATALPLFIVWIIGIVVAIVRWKKDRKKALFTLLGILLLGFVLLLEIVWNLFGVRWVNTDRSVFRIARTLMIVSPLVINLLKAGGWVLILMAIFSTSKKRDKSAEPLTYQLEE